MKRFCLKITGESGAGLLTTGEIITEGLQAMGYYVVADREYPSLIKGGASCFMINVDDEPIFGLCRNVDVMLSIDKQSMEIYHGDLKDEGVMVYGYERPLGVKEIVTSLEARKAKVVHLMTRHIAEEMGGNVLMTNVVLVGMLWKTLGLPYAAVEAEVKKKFASKPKLLALDLKCLKAGYDGVEPLVEMAKVTAHKKRKLLVNGHHGLALGAIHCGVRAYYAYPMSPSSNILTYMAEWADQTGMLVKQVEDEISVANMALGSMYMGTRALAATAGGGFDLMTETFSLAAITETPLVIVVAQRPGPATGLPTWTGQGDLNLAVHAAHGEFTRLVVAISDPSDAFELVQHAFNYAEEFQIPVVILSEKQVGETIWTTDEFEQGKVPIRRGLVEKAEGLKPEDRYEITESGISRRWRPGLSADAYYCANGDEHWLDGTVTEDGEQAKAMYEKRIRKGVALEAALPEPEVFGASEGAQISFVGWGSSKSVTLDVLKELEEAGVKANYLHYAYVWPLKKGRLIEFMSANDNVHLIEGNHNGQLGKLLGVSFQGRLLKWDGRQFYVEEVVEYANNNL